MAADRTIILNHVLQAVHALGEDLDLDVLREADSQTWLFGSKSGVDSITLVNLIADVEEHLLRNLNLSYVLADERAMSRQTSPFRRIETLVDYICELESIQ